MQPQTICQSDTRLGPACSDQLAHDLSGLLAYPLVTRTLRAPRTRRLFRLPHDRTQRLRCQQERSRRIIARSTLWARSNCRPDWVAQVDLIRIRTIIKRPNHHVVSNHPLLSDQSFCSDTKELSLRAISSYPQTSYCSSAPSDRTDRRRTSLSTLAPHFRAL